MSALTLNLFERRFSDLVKIGRARLPSLAPQWTDYNAHDPGITLMELLAWVGEAQLYSLSRVRRDERVAYAALLGIEPSGRRAATGLIWPDRLDRESPATTFTKSQVIPADAAIELAGSAGPTFRPARTLLWAPCTMQSLVTRHADGRTSNHTRTNERGTLAFFPFGETAGRRDVLVMSFACRDDAGLLGTGLDLKGAAWPLGVIAAPPAGGARVDANAPAWQSSLIATLVTPERRVRLPIVSDSSRALLTTGAILLDVSGLTISPTHFSIELSSARGFARPSRVLRIDPNVIPIRQGQSIVGESHDAPGLPDWSLTLRESGLRFAEGEEPITVDVLEPGGRETWRRGRLREQGPDDRVYELDTRIGEVTFGNGVNGRIPPAGSSALVSYAVCDGEQGNIARNRKWHLTGFPGAFGINLDPISGGASAPGWTEQRRIARRRARVEHALVSSDDIVAAANALPLLEVVRAWIVMPDARTPRTGTVTLVAMRSRTGDYEPAEVPETPRWLAAIRRQLAPRMPLGTRLLVRSPRYARFSIRATVEGLAGREPSTIKTAIESALGRRLALVERRGVTPRQPGVPVTSRDVIAWIKATEGVGRVLNLQLIGPDGKPADEIRVLRSGLPTWSQIRSQINVTRPESGSAE